MLKAVREYLILRAVELLRPQIVSDVTAQIDADITANGLTDADKALIEAVLGNE